MAKVGRKPRKVDVVSIGVDVDVSLWRQCENVCERFGFTKRYLLEKALRNYLTNEPLVALEKIRDIVQEYFYAQQ